jgi:hypothetical protein
VGGSMKKEEFLKIAQNHEYEIKEYKKGEFIYSQGWNNKVGYILEGEVLPAKHLSERIIRLPINFVVGEFIGINLYFFDHQNSNYFDVIAKVDNTKILFLEKELFEKLLKKEEFLKMLIYDNEKFALTTIALTVYLSFGPIGYFAYLINLEEVDGVVYFDRFLDYCEYVNINKTRLYEISNKLEKEELIKRGKKSIEIIDLEGLKKYYE